MKRFIMCVKDRAADTFGQPFFTPTRALAVRSLQDEVNRKAEDNPLAKHPEDYDLYCLGTFDDDDGCFECGEGLAVVARAQDLVRKE